MNASEAKKISKFLSLVLRHEPELLGITLDDAGWIAVDQLLEAAGSHGRQLTRAVLEEVVRTNDKQRFAFSEDGQRIRANQGHSVNVELGYEPCEPPDVLYHGTPQQFVEAIRREGLRKMARHHVHLHEDQNTAAAVGNRRGRAVLLRVQALRMHRAGHAYFVTANRVWLTDDVPGEYIEFPD